MNMKFIYGILIGSNIVTGVLGVFFGVISGHLGLTALGTLNIFMAYLLAIKVSEMGE